MRQSPIPYAGRRIALATRHGKQRVIAPALRHGLGAELLHLPALDTDRLGSFCGTVPRRGTALQACIAKAELALAHGGTGLAIASEGSFGPHPVVPLLAVGLECMVFLDRARGLTIHEELVARRTNFCQRSVAAEEIAAGVVAPALAGWLQAVGFPSHALIVRPQGVAAAAATVHKGLQQPDRLVAAISSAAAASPQGLAQLETDMRAHRNPTRMASIRRLAFRLARRLATPCPACASPGFGRLESVAGLPCAWCQTPTQLVLLERLRCQACGHARERPRRDGLESADPGACPLCNP